MSFHARSAEYFQIGGYQSHSHFWYQWDQAKLVKDFMSWSGNGLDLVYGIKHSGTSYLLLPVEDFNRMQKSLGLKVPQKRAYPAQDFISLSPIHFGSAEEFNDKLNFHKPNPRKKGKDSSKANNAYVDDNGGKGYPKAAYELNRLLYHILQKSVDAARFGLVKAPSLDSVDFFSFTFNIWLPGESLSILDLGFTSATLSGSSQLQFENTAHIMASETRTLGNPGLRKTEFEHGETVFLNEAERSTLLRSVFGKLQSAEHPIVIFVFNESDARTILNQHGINTGTWQSGIDAFLRSGLNVQRGSDRGGRFSRDPRYNSDSYRRRRSQSPQRGSSSSSYDSRRRSPSPRAKPLAGNVYIVDVLQLCETANGLPLRGRWSLAKAAESLGLNVDSNVWCAGNESRLLVEMWKAIASGPDIGDQLRGSAGVAAQPMASGSAMVSDSAQGPPPDEDSDVDPNDIVPNMATNKATLSMAQYLDNFDQVDGEEDDDDWEYTI